MSRELSGLAERCGIDLDMEILELGLHSHPQKLHQRLQEALLRPSAGAYDRVLLAFGLCGGAAKDLLNGELPLVLPRSHDCIPVLLGSFSRFNFLREQEPGTFYLTRGLLEGAGSIPGEYRTYCEKYGEQKALRLQKALYRNYTRFLYVKTNAGSEDGDASERIRESARRLNLRYEETDWEEDYLKNLLTGPWDRPELFITLPPHSVLTEEQFGL